MTVRTPAVILAEPDAGMRQEIRDRLIASGLSVIEVDQREQIGLHLAGSSAKLLILQSSWDDAADGIAIAREIRSRTPALPIVLIARKSSEAIAIAALRAGVSDYFRPPISSEALVSSIRQHVSRLSETNAGASVESTGPAKRTADELVGESDCMRKIKSYIDKVARTECNVVITGETGTGKELVARLIHAASGRCAGPLVTINCAAIPDSLLESELFGYERGAFTGAHARKEGQLKLADRGTVFLDEIGDMSSYAQAKVLRAIENKEVYRLGGKSIVPLDIRIIAATHRNLEHVVADGGFRSDLFFRLNVGRIEIPPLRERREDIPSLSTHFCRALSTKMNRAIDDVSDDAIAALQKYHWPGNVRELRNALECASITVSSWRISLADLPERIRAAIQSAERISASERDRLIATLVATNWNISRAAQALRWSRMTLYRKAAKYRITRVGGVSIRPRGTDRLDPASDSETRV